MELLEALIEDKNEANKIYNKTYDRWYKWYMSNYEEVDGCGFLERYEEDANKFAYEKADEAVKKYYKS